MLLALFSFLLMVLPRLAAAGPESPSATVGELTPAAGVSVNDTDALPAGGKCAKVVDFCSATYFPPKGCREPVERDECAQFGRKSSITCIASPSRCLESCVAAPASCCGNGTCDSLAGEDPSNCCTDCGCPKGSDCLEGRCVGRCESNRECGEGQVCCKGRCRQPLPCDHCPVCLAACDPCKGCAKAPERLPCAGNCCGCKDGICAPQDNLCGPDAFCDPVRCGCRKKCVFSTDCDKCEVCDEKQRCTPDPLCSQATPMPTGPTKCVSDFGIEGSTCLFDAPCCACDPKENGRCITTVGSCVTSKLCPAPVRTPIPICRFDADCSKIGLTGAHCCCDSGKGSDGGCLGGARCSPYACPSSAGAVK